MLETQVGVGLSEASSAWLVNRSIGDALCRLGREARGDGHLCVFARSALISVGPQYEADSTHPDGCQG